MGFASGSRDAVLSTLCEDVAANGTAPLLTGLSFADIAATAGVSASSVRRAVRTLDRLDALVSSHLGRAGIDTRADLRLSGAPRERRLHPGQPGAIAGVIDAAIDTPRTRPFIAPDKPDDFFCKPTAIAEELWHAAHQDRSAWSFLVELRPFGEVW